MACPSCGGATKVIDTYRDDGRRWRRHRCRICATKFSTYEIPAVEYERLQGVRINMSVINAALAELERVKKAVRE